jgi:hypothetical protein
VPPGMCAHPGLCRSSFVSWVRIYTAYWSVFAQQMDRRLPASHSASWNHV